LRRERRASRSLPVAELVEAYLEQHDVDPVTIEKLRWLLGKAVAVFGDRPVGELRSQEIAAWPIALSPGYRFDGTQALRQVLSRAVLWGMIDVNPAKLGVDNPSPRRREQRPCESWAELDAVAANLTRGIDRWCSSPPPPGFVQRSGSRSKSAMSTARHASSTSAARSQRVG
jgi:hypothetical protein